MNREYDINEVCNLVNKYLEEKTHYKKSYSGKMVPIYGTAARIADAYATKHDKDVKANLHDEEYGKTFDSAIKSYIARGDLLDIAKASRANKDYKQAKKEIDKKNKIVQFLNKGSLNYKQSIGDEERAKARTIKKTYIPEAATYESVKLNIYEAYDIDIITEDEKDMLLSLLNEG